MKIKTKSFIELSKKIAKEIKDLILGDEFKTAIKATHKASEDETGAFEIVISTEDVDRQGEKVKIEGLDLVNYKKNPIVLWAHEYRDLPIGITDDIKIQGKKLIAKGRFAPMSANPFAQQVRELYDLGIMKTASVGFIAKEVEVPEGEDSEKPVVIKKAELLEWSFVPIPANPNARARAKELKLNIEELKQKGLFVDPDKDKTVKRCRKPKPRRRKEDLPASELAGRVLSKENRAKIKTAIDIINKTAAALQELLDATEASDKDKQGRRPKDNPKKLKKAKKEKAKQRSGDVGLDLDYDEWASTRQILRLVNNITSNALAKFNKRIVRKK